MGIYMPFLRRVGPQSAREGLSPGLETTGNSTFAVTWNLSVGV